MWKCPGWVKSAVLAMRRLLPGYPINRRSQGASASLKGAVSEHIQLDCGPDPTSPALRASSASFVKIFFPAMRPDSQAPVI
jgi:hypothetical protein